MVGKATIRIPPAKFAMRDTDATVEMIRVAFHFEIAGVVGVVVRASGEMMDSVRGSILEIVPRPVPSAMGARWAIESNSMARESACVIVDVVVVDILAVR
jgi:hypothetical protein